MFHFLRLGRLVWNRDDLCSGLDKNPLICQQISNNWRHVSVVTLGISLIYGNGFNAVVLPRTDTEALLATRLRLSELHRLFSSYESISSHASLL